MLTETSVFSRNKIRRKELNFMIPRKFLSASLEYFTGNQSQKRAKKSHDRFTFTETITCHLY